MVHSRACVCVLCVAFLGLATVGPAAAADLVPLTPPGPSWSLGLRSTAYAYQTEDAAGAATDHLRVYEHFAGSASGLAGGRLTFRASGRFADTPADAGPTFAAARLHTGVLEARLGTRWRVDAGRQFLQCGVAGLTLDGVRARWRGAGGTELTAWGGGAVPFGHAFDVADFDQDAAAGGQVSLRPGRGQRLAVSAAYRERWGRVAARPVGLEYTTAAVRHVNALGRATYDLEGEHWTKLEVQGRWRQRAGRPLVTVQYVDRRPSVDAASWFARFTDLKRIRLARASLRWTSAARWGGELEYVGSFVGGRTNSRVGVAALLPWARAGYSLRTGDAGDENSVYGEVAWQARPWLRLEGEASYLTYALFADAPEDQERDLTTLLARVRVHLRSGLNLTAEVQSLDTPLYDKDVRLLVGVDMVMGRGVSRFGLDRGGWL